MTKKEKMTKKEIDWREVLISAVEEAHTQGIKNDVVAVYRDGTFARIQKNSSVVCENHSIDERCEHCEVVLRISLWTLTDEPCYQFSDTQGKEREGYIYNCNNKEWVKYDDELIETWAEEYVDENYLDKLEEALEE